MSTFEKYVTFVFQLLNTVKAASLDTQLLSRMLSQVIYDTPTKFSGLASVSAIKRKIECPMYKPTKEHFNVRQMCGERLIQLLHAPFTELHVRDIMINACSVHYVTSEENQILRKYQPVYGDAAYDKANIILVEAEELFSKRGRQSAKWHQQMKNKFEKYVDSVT